MALYLLLLLLLLLLLADSGAGNVLQRTGYMEHVFVKTTRWHRMAFKMPLPDFMFAFYEGDLLVTVVIASNCCGTRTHTHTLLYGTSY